MTLEGNSLDEKLIQQLMSEDRYPRRNRKTKVENLSFMEESEHVMNKAEELTKLPYNVEDILNSPDFEGGDDILTKISVNDFDIDYIRRTGLASPLFFDVSPGELGMKMPSPDEFYVDNVLECIGGNRKIEVVRVCEQSGRLMKLKDFINYYKKPSEERKELLNVLSLEFTSTRLADLVSAPEFVSKIDWIDHVWPKELFKRQENLLTKSAWARDHDFSTYPKIQRYCLMSVANCFTDFHIDFGGTSVWYHVLKGQKVFWLIEPTEENIKLYEEWILGGSSNSCFFGKIVNKCTRIWLKQGNTLIIPSGWIHCVYTPIDSLVFGGNFLHSFAIPMQIRVSKSEDRLKIGSKYRFPHFKQIFWCYAAKIIKNATQRNYQKQLTEEAYLPISQTTQPESDKFKGEIVENDSEASEHYFKAENEIFHQTQQTNSMLEVCYDEGIGNAEDGTWSFNPIQHKFGDQRTENFVPSHYYDLDYIRSLSSFEINGLHSLLIFIKRLLHSRQSEVVEGITRPAHLILELEMLMRKIDTLDLLNIQFDFQVSPKVSSIKKKTEITMTTNKAVENIKLNLKFSPKKTKQPPSIRRIESKSASSIQAKPVLVDGLPLPTHMASKEMGNANLHTPAGDFIKLGQKSIPSAWRRSANMTRPPPLNEFFQLKRNHELSQQLQNSVDPSIYQFSEDYHSTTSTAIEQQNIQKDQKKKILRVKPRINADQRSKVIEVHDNSPEFLHRSPLQRYSNTQPKNSQLLSNQKSQQHQQTTNIYNSKYMNDNIRRPKSCGFENASNLHSYTNNKWNYSFDTSNAQEDNRQKGSINNDRDWGFDTTTREDNRQEGSADNDRGWGFDTTTREYNRQQGSADNHKGWSRGGNSFERTSGKSWNSYSEASNNNNKNWSGFQDDHREIQKNVNQTHSFEKTSYSTTRRDEEPNCSPCGESCSSNIRKTYAEADKSAGFYQKSTSPESQQNGPQPISSTANELHQLSRIMDHPASYDLEQIPLPPSPKQPKMDNVECDDPTMVNGKPLSPFHEVDRLAELGMLMER